MGRSSDPQPPRHGRVISGAPGRMTAKRLRGHMAELTGHAKEVRNYGCHGTGFIQADRQWQYDT